MKERTLTIIKPECVEAKHTGEIISRIETSGFEILGIKMVKLDRKDAEQFYAVHKGRPFFEDLINYMSSGKVVAMVLEKDNCVEDFRRFIGATDPAKAEKDTIRSDFGTSIQYNCVHASDSNENAVKEAAFFFSQKEIIECE